MCSKQVVSTSRRLAAERGLGDDSIKTNENLVILKALQTYITLGHYKMVPLQL